jgi:hypothetical protein
VELSWSCSTVFVADPLRGDGPIASAENNVGRSAFKIRQIKFAFENALQALYARVSEWPTAPTLLSRLIQFR